MSIAVHVGGVAGHVLRANRHCCAEAALTVKVHQQQGPRACSDEHVVVAVVIHVKDLHRGGAFHRDRQLGTVLGAAERVGYGESDRRDA
jgi:hypothetical protein